jgi:hypothetical protein
VRPSISSAISSAIASVCVIASACASSTGTSPDAGRRWDTEDAGARADGGGALACEALEPCGSECVDTASDPKNCGGCARTCVIPNAVAGCAIGECAIAACHDDYYDVDLSVENGCEIHDLCASGSPCTTGCGSTGTTACADGVPTCMAPVESCNLADDDCSGACDDAALRGCRVGVHRSVGTGHYYTTDLAEASGAPWTLEAADFFYLYARPTGSLRPLFRCARGDGRTYLTTDTGCDAMGGLVATLGFIAATPECGAQPLYHAVHSSGDFFYTTSEAEHANALAAFGYTDGGIRGYIWTSP